MLKRTKGRLLLAMLVITGLAGTLSDTALNKKERKFAVNHLKNSKSSLLKNTADLTEAQLNFRPAPDKWTIKECVTHIALAESTLWKLLETSMSQPATPERRKEATFSDQQLIEMIEDRSKKATAPEVLNPKKSAWKNTAEALAAFKESRNAHLKYVRTTTEDLRNHIIELSFGKVDGYQFLLFVSAHANRHIEQIKDIRDEPNFPR